MGIAKDVIGSVHFFNFFLGLGHRYQTLFAFVWNRSMINMIDNILKFLQLFISVLFHCHRPSLIVKIKLLVYIFVFKLASFYFEVQIFIAALSDVIALTSIISLFNRFKFVIDRYFMFVVLVTGSSGYINT